MKQKIQSFIGFLVDIIKNRGLLYSLAVNDIKVRYLGSYMGILWAFIQPLVTICIMWFVFEVGFRAAPKANVPFILWLVAGMIPWFFLADAIGSASNSIVDNSYLVKKVVFRISLLPLIKILSALFIHAFFIIFLLFMFGISGYFPGIHATQLIYYLFASVCFIIGLSFITSSIVVFARDFGQIIGVIIQLLFWATPIFWSLDAVPAKYHYIFFVNPIFYIINGYRDALINKVWFWQHPIWALYFWGITLLLFAIGALIFRKLKPHFADVL